MTNTSDLDSTERSLRLIVVTEEFSGTISGGAHVRHRFCELADEWGHNIMVLTARKDDAPRRETLGDIDIIRLTPTSPDFVQGLNPLALVYRLLFSLALFVYLMTWLPWNRVDGLHSASTASHWAVKTLSVLFNIPVVNFLGLTQSATSTDTSLFASLLEWANFRLFMGDVVFCRNSGTKTLVSRYVNSEVEILHGILNRPKIEGAIERTPNVTAREFVSSDAGYVVSAVGRLVPIKNPTGSIDILADLPSEYELVVIGDGPERTAVERQAMETNGRAHVLGRLPHNQTLDVIATADALVLSSHAEAYPSVVFEALALGTDVFARPVGILPELEHERLHVAPFERLAEEIANRDLSNRNPDFGYLDSYSIERYTATVLNTHARLAD